MTKYQIFKAAAATSGVLGGLLAVSHAFAADYLITATDTVPIFQDGATAVKQNGLAILQVAVPYVEGALVALAIVWVAILVARHFRP